MNLFNKLKKGQGLPLNTIVLAILVIIVLLVIIVFFTGNVAKSGKQINQVNGCNPNNAVLKTLEYSNIHSEDAKDTKQSECNNGKRISMIPSQKDSINEGKFSICCGNK